MEEKPEYKAGPASIFHGHAVQVPAPLWCNICGTFTMEFRQDNGKFEIYQCTCCGMLQSIAMR